MRGVKVTIYLNEKPIMPRVILALCLIVFCLGEVAAQQSPNLPPPVVAIKSKSEFRHPEVLYGAQIFTALGFGSGSGSMSFSPQEPGPDFVDQEYVVTVNTSFRFSMGAAFQYKKLQIGATFGPEVYQVGEQILRRTSREPILADAQRLRARTNYIWLDDWTYVTRSPNTGEWPRYIFHYGVFAEYNFNIGKKFRFSPIAGFNKYFYFATQPFVIANDRNLNDFFTGRTQYNFGGRFKILLNERAYLGFGVLYRVTEFDASNYFTDIRTDTFEQSYNQTYVEFTYTYRFWSI